jgi:hypothetical protein
VTSAALAVFAGLATVLTSTVAAEAWWLALRPRTPGRALACWVLGIFSRVIVALSGIAISVALLDLSRPPLIVALVAGYAVALTLETRLTLRRLGRLQQQNN